MAKKRTGREEGSRKRRGREEGSIYQRQDGLWVCSLSMGYDGNGKRKRKIIYGKTKKEVAEELRKLQTAFDRGTLPEAGSITVAQFLGTWLESIKSSVATHTHIAYKRDCNNAIIPHIGGVKLGNLTALHVQKLFADLGAKGVSVAMQKKAGITLGVALQHAVNIRLIPHNVARDVKKPQHTPKEMKVLDLEQIQAFLESAKSDRLYALYAFMLDSGSREGEAFALLWSDFDWKNNAVQIRRNLEETAGKHKLKELKTKKSRRRIVLSSFTMDAMTEHRKQMLAEGNYKADGPVFCDSQGNFLRKSNVLRRSFRPIIDRHNNRELELAKKTGKEPFLLPEIRPYDLRHTNATMLLLCGEDSKIVAERLGHSTTRLTQDVYQHVLPGMQERAASKLDAIFRQSKKESG